MARVVLTVEVESPLVLSADRQSSNPAGLRYVSGSTFRGALASRYLEGGRPEDELFQALFLDEDTTRFSPLYPGQRVLPLTAMSCKRSPGFVADGGHGIWDTSVNLAKRALGQDIHEDLTCPKCGNALRMQEGFIIVTREAPAPEGAQGERLNRVRLSTLTHVGIDPTTLTASPAILFSEEAIDPGQKLWGSVCTSEELCDALQRLLAEPLHVGRGRARGCGRIRVHVTRDQAMSTTAMQSRVEWWSTRFAELVGKDGLWFSLGTHAELICVDKYLRPSSDPADLVPWLPRASKGAARAFGSGQLEFLAAVMRPALVRGWHAAHGLPRQDDPAVARGSVYLYRLCNGSADDLAVLVERLTYLVNHRIGLRRNEGYGDVVVCDPFHVIYGKGEAGVG